MLQQNQLSPTETLITVTPTAVSEAKRLMAMEQKEGLFLRLGVTSGGCSGMSYSMSFDSVPSEMDREFDFDGLPVRVDLKALMYLKGCTVDFVTGLMGGGFKFINPSAKRSCSCGSSFTC